MRWWCCWVSKKKVENAFKLLSNKNFCFWLQTSYFPSSRFVPEKITQKLMERMWNWKLVVSSENLRSREDWMTMEYAMRKMKKSLKISIENWSMVMYILHFRDDVDHTICENISALYSPDFDFLALLRHFSAFYSSLTTRDIPELQRRKLNFFWL